MPLTPEDRRTAAQKAMEMYQQQGYGNDLKYGKTRAVLGAALNRSDPNSFASQAITAMGGNPEDYTTGALVGKGLKGIAKAFQKK